MLIGHFVDIDVPITMWLTTLTVFILLICQSQCHEDDQVPLKETSTRTSEFAHLLHRASQSKRVHLLAEHIRDGYRLYIEEYTDLSSWSQFIQFKWSEERKTSNETERTLATEKINVLILNNDDRKILIQYEPFNCSTTTYYISNGNFEEDWKSLIQLDNYNLTQSLRDRYALTIKSVLSASIYSPYLARIHGKYLINDTSVTDEVWLFGITGLWVKAQFPTKDENKSKLLLRRDNDDIWRLELKEADTNLVYYFDNILFGKNQSESLSKSEYESISMIELESKSELHSSDLINIINVEFDIDNDSFENIFKLPIGYNCQSNPLLSKEKVRFEDSLERSHFIQLELVAKRLSKQQSMKQLVSTDIKNLEVATSKHPLDAEASLIMYHILEDRLKVVKDSHSEIVYSINKIDHDVCKVHPMRSSNNPQDESQEPVIVKFNNDVSLRLTKSFLDYLVNDLKTNKTTMKFMNLRSISSFQEEAVFESSSMAEAFENVMEIRDDLGGTITHRLVLVKTYVRLKPFAFERKVHRNNFLKLTHVRLIAFDPDYRTKLTEIRINLVKKIQPISYTRKAKLFNLSTCFKEKSIHLQVSYPIEPKVLEQAQELSHELVEEFYKSSLNWQNLNTSGGILMDKDRLRLSLNFLRIPQVNLKLGTNGLLDIDFKLIDKPSPINRFLRMNEVTFISNNFVERLLIRSAEECARYCQLFNCKMFAFDEATQECKLSPFSINVKNNISKTPSDTRESRTFQHNITTKYKKSSSVYYSRLQIKKSGTIDHIEEASLSELYSYFEHNIVDDLSGNSGDTLVNLQRYKRGATLNEWPLLSFQIRDRYRSSESYSPPSYFTLVPNQIRAISVPLSFDLAENSNSLKVASSFRTQLVDKTYHLTALDQFDPYEHSWMLELRERTFIDYSNSTYYTLKLLQLTEMESCSLMCYNIEEWDFQTGSEQTCISFSYCSLEQDCILLVKTDFNFTSSILDIVHEGGRVHEITSVTELMREEQGCSISVRNYLNGFDGPIRLQPDNYGYLSTDGLDIKLTYEWLLVFSIETRNFPEEAQEKCAKKCIEYNKREGRVCLAIDFCLKTYYVKKESEYIKREEVLCNLFLIDQPSYNIKSKHIKEMSQAREQLSQVRTLINKGKVRKSPLQCNRYLVSHLLNFYHLKQRQISAELRDLLYKPVPSIKNLNLQDCAFECSMRFPRCAAFEYCNKIEDETKEIVRECNLFEAPKQDISPEQALHYSKNANLSTFSSACHIYLRSDINSIENLLTLNNGSLANIHFGKLILLFALLYIVTVLTLLIYSDTIRNPFNRLRFVR